MDMKEQADFEEKLQISLSNRPISESKLNTGKSSLENLASPSPVLKH